MRNVNWAKQATSVFGGVNRRKRIADGEWGEAENLSTRDYPTATVREKRVVRSLRAIMGDVVMPTATQLGGGTDAVCSDGLVYLASYESQIGGMVVVGSQVVQTAGKPTQIVAFGRGAFTIDGTFIPYPEAGEQTAKTVEIEINEQIKIEIADEDGQSMTERWLYDGKGPVDDVDSYYQGMDATYGKTRPNAPSDGDKWFDTQNGGLYQYDAKWGEWMFVCDSYILLVGVSGLSVGDFVTIDANGFPMSTGNYEVVKVAKQKETVNISRPDQEYLVEVDVVLVKGIIPYSTDNTQGWLVDIRRRCPVLDFIVSHRNRVWGCRYGVNDEGKFVNEIYGSELGNCLNFFRFDGLASDSYMASVGKGGAWTGIAAVEDNVFFFKEDRIFWLSGTEPSDFRLREIEGPGIAPRQAKSVIVKDGSIYYKATRGFMRISGYSYPVGISTKIDEVSTGPLVGVADGDRLRWIGEDAVYVLDLHTGAWMTESPIVSKAGFVLPDGDGERVDWRTCNPVPYAAFTLDGYPVVFVATLAVLFGIPAATTEAVTFKDIDLPTEGFPMPELPTPEEGEEIDEWTRQWMATAEEEIAWHAVTGLRGLADVELKRLRSLQVRVVTEGECAVKAWIEYDLDGTWVPIANEKRVKKGTFLIRHEVSRQCDVYRLKFEGVGDVTIYDIAEELEYGGEFAR